MESSQPIRGKALTNHNFITHIFSCTVWAFYHILSEFSLAPCVVYCGADLFLSVINVVGFAYEKCPLFVYWDVFQQLLSVFWKVWHVLNILKICCFPFIKDQKG